MLGKTQTSLRQSREFQTKMKGMWLGCYGRWCRKRQKDQGGKIKQCSLLPILNKQNCIDSNSLMSVLCLNVCRLCVPNIMSLGASSKKLHLVKDVMFAWYTAKICVIFGVRFERGIARERQCTWTSREQYCAVLTWSECGSDLFAVWNDPCQRSLLQFWFLLR